MLRKDIEWVDPIWAKGLTERVANCVTSQFATKDELEKAITENKKINGIGNKGMDEIWLWLGFGERPKKKRPLSEHTKIRITLSHELPKLELKVKSGFINEDDARELLILVFRINNKT